MALGATATLANKPNPVVGVKSLGCSLAVLGIALFASITSATACGIDWKVPTNHFDGVNEMGELSYWRSVGQIDFGSDLKIPLIIGFKPNRGGSSCLGRGWIVPILESSIVQIDEKKFLLTQPDGITRQFWRKKPTDSNLRGQGNWQGTISENTITLWAECGWKLVFSKGKLASITTPKNRILNVVYVNGRASEIQEQGKTALKVESDWSGTANGLSFGMNHIGIEVGERPRVDVIMGANVVSGIEKSLHTLTLSGTSRAVYDFGVDEKVQQTLKISGDTSRSFTWNPATGRLLKDGVWSYDINQGKDRWLNAGIGRTNVNQQSEYWYNDAVNGCEVTLGIDGIKKTVTRFTSGKLSGKIRTEVQEKGQTVLVNYKASYDENGRLLRTTLAKGGTMVDNRYDRDKEGNLLSTYLNGKKTLTNIYENGRLKERILENGKRYRYAYRGDGSIERTMVDALGHKITEILRDRKIVSRMEQTAELSK